MIVLLQFRTDQAGWHELKCIYDGLGVDYHEYKIVNLLSDFVNPESLITDFKQANGVILGGSGELGWEVYKDGDKNKIKSFEKILKKLKEPLLSLIEKDTVPLLATCFGHQILAYFLGSELKLDESQAETGIYKIYLTKEGEKSPLFRGLGKEFKAVLGHKASITRIPANKDFQVLAYSDKCKVQAFKYKRNTYGVQFHPELNYDDLLFRLSLYPSYGEIKSKRVKILTPLILKNFRSLINQN